MRQAYFPSSSEYCHFMLTLIVHIYFYFKIKNTEGTHIFLLFSVSLTLSLLFVWHPIYIKVLNFVYCYLFSQFAKQNWKSSLWMILISKHMRCQFKKLPAWGCRMLQKFLKMYILWVPTDLGLTETYCSAFLLLISWVLHLSWDFLVYASF